MNIIHKQRKTNFLSTSGLRCLAGFPTVNLSAGCAHQCIYCYTKGYSIYPGDETIEVYSDMADRICSEIKKKRSKPKAVYFCPSSDPFQPVHEVQQSSYEVMKMLLSQGIGVQFVTKGRISEETLKLFESYNSLVCGQIGITSIDDDIRKIIEPNTATVKEKLTQLKRLIDAKIQMSMRCDPLIHGLMDSGQQLEKLIDVASTAGCNEIAVSFLFLRPAITKGLKDNINNQNLLKKIIDPYSESVQLPVGIKNSAGKMLSTELRKNIFSRIKKIADLYNISVNICGCKNPDITNGTCNLIRQPADLQKRLF